MVKNFVKFFVDIYFFICLICIYAISIFILLTIKGGRSVHSLDFSKDKLNTMAKKNNSISMQEANTAGIEKFRKYAEPRNIYMKEATYGVRSVIHGNKKTQLEAVDAVCNGETGWIVNLANRQRKFVTAKDGYKVV